MALTFSSGPNGNDTKQPMYPGFEQDVLKTVADYYQKLKEPLLTFYLYEVFVNILSKCFTSWTHYRQIFIIFMCVCCQIVGLDSSYHCRSASGAGCGH